MSQLINDDDFVDGETYFYDEPSGNTSDIPEDVPTDETFIPDETDVTVVWRKDGQIVGTGARLPVNANDVGESAVYTCTVLKNGIEVCSSSVTVINVNDGYQLVISATATTATTVTYTGKLLKGTQDVTSQYPAANFSWQLESEAGTQALGSGLTCTIPLADVGYGATVILTYNDEGGN